MLMIMRVSIPVETGNAASKKGTLGSTIQKILGEMKPEAAYFAEENGMRTGYIFFQMTDQSELPAVAEPWFLAFNATLTVKPAMGAAGSGQGAAPAIKRAAKNYAK